MRRSAIVLRSILAISMLVFFVCAPPFLRQSLQTNIYRSWLENTKPEWTGIITLWHVVGFKTYQGSVSSFLEQRAAAYESAHRGVYWKILAMTPEEMQERYTRGERPDAWSFALGTLYPEQLSPFSDTLDMPALRGGLTPALSDGVVYGLPYLYSGYFLICNTQLLQKSRLEWPDTDQIAWLREALAAAPDAALLAGDPIIAARLSLTGEPEQYSRFQSEKVPLAIADARALGDLSRKRSSNNGGFTFECAALGGYTPQVQYIAADAKADAQRKLHIEAFACTLLEETSQQKLTALGALPVIETEPVYANDLMTSLYDAYASPQIPQAFAYQRHAGQLYTDALRALNGEPDDFAARMNEVLGFP